VHFPQKLLMRVLISFHASPLNYIHVIVKVVQLFDVQQHFILQVRDEEKWKSSKWMKVWTKV